MAMASLLHSDASSTLRAPSPPSHSPPQAFLCPRPRFLAFGSPSPSPSSSSSSSFAACCHLCCSFKSPPPNPRLRSSSPLGVRAQAPVSEVAARTLTGTWTWQKKNSDWNVKVYYEEYAGGGDEKSQNVLLLPSISDVSTTEEWKDVASQLIRRGGPRWRFMILDWPGFGLSDRPRIDYTADALESFLVDFISASNSPLGISESPLIIVGGGHAATLALRATQKRLIKVRAIAAVAPTWAGPMPIVFGRTPEMETRYSLLRSSLRAPGVGWMMYNLMVSSAKSIREQYTSHVYADPKNVTPPLLESRLALTKREGARFAPAAFLTGLLDPVSTREEFVSLFESVGEAVPLLVLGAANAPKRSKAEMEALNGAKGISKYVEVKGALLPQEEFPDSVSEELCKFLVSVSSD